MKVGSEVSVSQAPQGRESGLHSKCNQSMGEDSRMNNTISFMFLPCLIYVTLAVVWKTGNEHGSRKMT